MRNIIKNLGSIMLLTCLSLILLTGCSRKSQLKLAIEMANKQCPMSIVQESERGNKVDAGNGSGY